MNEKNLAPPSGPQATGVSYAARLGIAHVALPAHQSHYEGEEIPSPPLRDVYDAIIEAFGKDSRVERIEAPPGGENKYYHIDFATPGQDADRKSWNIAPSIPHRHVHGIQFKNPIVLGIRVPKRLQGAEKESDVPAEEYWVAWDGVSILVAWVHDATSQGSFAPAGGVIAISVIEEAVKAAGFNLRRQPCGPSCSHPFAHNDLVISPGSGKSLMLTESAEPYVVEVACPAVTSIPRLMHHLGRSFFLTSLNYARLRSHASTMREVEGRARRDLSSLLFRQYQHASLSEQPILRSIPMRWKSRKDRREIARLTATLWLRLATLEENLKEWKEARYLYDQAASRHGLHLMFAMEYPEEVNNIQALEVSGLRAAVDRMSSSIDNRAVVVATTVGAIAGAVAGALVGQI